VAIATSGLGGEADSWWPGLVLAQIRAGEAHLAA
jgi:hypothetical protein